MKVDVYTLAGQKKGDLDLPKEMFGAKINQDLMHRAVVMRLANARKAIAHTKTRGEISATTKKLFRQKGTGNARRGAKSTNLLRGGGVTHGPRSNANYAKAMPKKERRAALFSSLTVKAKEKAIVGLEATTMKAPKTKDAAIFVDTFDKDRKMLFVFPEKNENMRKSLRNIPGVKTILASYLNPYDVLHADKVCFVGDAVKKAQEVFMTPAK